jgi:hypothetical protein
LAERFRGDAHLEGAALDNARYDARTIWPGGFDPKAAGAVPIEEDDELGSIPPSA